MKPVPPPKRSPDTAGDMAHNVLATLDLTRKLILEDRANAVSIAEVALNSLRLNFSPDSHINTKQNGKLTLRKPGEFLSMDFDDSDIILGDRLLAAGQSLVIAAQGGAGKSRLLMQLAATVVSGKRFLTMLTGGAQLHWLILQTENSNRRLKKDLAPLKTWLGDAWKHFDERITIHSFEQDSDSFVSLDSADNLANIAAAIEDTKPDIIVVDPLNDFGIGDLNQDADMKATLRALSRVCRTGNPHRAIIVLHHALTGRSGATKATGYDRASFARNSKALHAWTRGQVNLAPVDADDNDRLIVACGKCSNGREFPRFAVRLNKDTMIYEVDSSVDLKEWESQINGKSGHAALLTPDGVAKLCCEPMNRSDLAKVILKKICCPRTATYRYIDRAVSARKIKLNEKTELYSAV